MIRIISPFKDAKNKKVVRRFDEVHDFGKKRNESLVNNGFAEWVNRDTKELKTKIKNK